MFSINKILFCNRLQKSKKININHEELIMSKIINFCKKHEKFLYKAIFFTTIIIYFSTVATFINNKNCNGNIAYFIFNFFVIPILELVVVCFLLYSKISSGDKIKFKELLLLLAVVIVMFANLYLSIYINDRTSFLFNEIKENTDFIASSSFKTGLDFIYFSMMTFSTVGYGDIVPVSSCARLYVMFEIFFSYSIFVIYISLFFNKDKKDKKI